MAVHTMAGTSGKNTNSFPVASFRFAEEIIFVGEELLKGKIPHWRLDRIIARGVNPVVAIRGCMDAARTPALIYEAAGIPIYFEAQSSLRDEPKRERSPKRRPWVHREPTLEDMLKTCPRRSRKELLALSAAARDRRKEAKERAVTTARSEAFVSRVRAAHNALFEAQMGGLTGYIKQSLETVGESLGRGLTAGLREEAPAMAADCASAATARVEEVVGNRIEGLVKQVKAMLKSIKQAAIAAFGESGPVVKAIVAILGAALPVWFFYALAKWTGISQAIVSAVSSFFVPEVPVVEAQMGENGETELIGQALFAATLAALIPKDKTQAKMWAPFVALMTKSTPFVSGAKSLVDWVCEGIQWTVNIIIRAVGGGEIQWFKKRAEQIDVWLARSRDYLKSEDTIPPEEIVRHYSDGHDLVRTAAGQVSKAEIDAMLRQLTQKWNVARTERALMKAARPEPICLVLYGAPGVGKSISLDYFHKYITVATNPDIATRVRESAAKGEEYPLSAHAYVKDSGKYWTGYNPSQHTTMILDDGGTRKPVPGADDSDFINLMRIINSAPVSLDMPDIESKGNVFFRSPFVIVSTNLNKAQWASNANAIINNPDALERRMRLFLEVTISDKRMIKDGKLNIDAWSCATPEEQDKAWEYKGTWDKAPITFDSRKALAAFVASKMSEARGHFIRMSANSTNQALADALGIQIQEVSAQMDFPGVHTQEEAMDQFAAYTARLRADQDAGGPGVFAPAAFVFKGSGLGSARAVMATAAAAFLEWVESASMFEIVRNSLLGGMALRFIFDALVAGVRAVYNFMCPGKKADCRKQAQDPSHVMDNVTDNMYVLGLAVDGEDLHTSLGAVLFVRGQYALMPHHFLRGLAKAHKEGLYEGSVPTLRSLGTGRKWYLRWEQFNPEGANVETILGYDGMHQDICIVKIEGREHKNITGSFMTQGVRKPMDLGWVTFGDNFAPMWEHDLHRPEYLQNFTYENESVQRAVSYRKATRKGDCGSVVVSQGESGRVYIVGMHVAGADKDNFGIAALVFQDQLERTLSKIDQNVARLVATKASVTQDKFVKQSGSILDARAVALTSLKNGVPDRPDAPPSMVPSVAVGWSDNLLSHGKVPSVCTEKATEKALEAYAVPSIFPRDGYLGPYAFEAARAMLDQVGAPLRFNLRLPTNVEAVNGRVHGVQFAEPINRRTSSGYPWQNMGHTKARIFDQRTGEIMLGSATTQVIFNEADELLEALKHGDSDALNYVLFKVAPKREMRKAGKDPRVIQGAPLHFVIVFRRLFWALLGHFAQWTPEKELAIGLDPMTHWTDLHDWITELYPEGHKPCVVGAGDYKQFDQCQEPVISTAIGEAVMERYHTGGPLDIARRLAWKTLCGPRVVFRNVVYQLDKGMPSGHPATSVANGLYNGVLFRIAYASIVMEGTDHDVFPQGGDAFRYLVRSFRDHVHLSVCGDDNLFSTDEPLFNEMTLSACMSRFGARYTMDVKDQTALQEYRPIEDVSYLGRGFRWERGPGKWVAPLRLESVGIMGQYAEKVSQLCPEWYTSVAKQIRAELSLHPQEVWDHWMPAYKATFVDRGFVPGFASPEGVASARVVWQPAMMLREEDSDFF